MKYFLPLILISLFPLKALPDIKNAFKETFQGEIKKLGGTLEIKIFRQIPSSWAIATKKNNEYTITIFGGYLVNPHLTNDSLALLLCHELGHFLGGHPKRRDEDENPTWSSIEGQADYFAPSCLFKFLKSNPQFRKNKFLPPFLISECNKIYFNENDSVLCQRVLIASMDLIKVFNHNEIHKDENLPSFTTPDLTIVDELWEKHPNLQCRLDTYIAGALKKPRPLCWFID